MKKIITIIGARPQIIKAAAISRAIKNEFSEKINEIVVHTGQHYDAKMSGDFFEELNIPKPNYQLSISSKLQGAKTGEMMREIELVVEQEKPDAVLVYGDTNSTLAGALVAAKLHIPVIHVEAGLRSFNKSMPEEINRITTDHCSVLLFSPTAEGIKNLKAEGINHLIGKQEVYHCGDIMYDNSLYFEKLALEKSKVFLEFQIVKGEFNLVTCHRPSNTDSKENLSSIINALKKIKKIDGKQLVFPLHPRTEKMILKFFGSAYLEDLRNDWIVLPPVSFLDMILLESSAHAVITDSGGVQKEAYFFHKKSIILREETEWVEIIENKGGILTGSNGEKIITAYQNLNDLDCTFEKVFGNGKAAEFICEKILKAI
jgi:UDP-GlcNAc3NAcA epimerase